MKKLLSILSLLGLMSIISFDAHAYKYTFKNNSGENITVLVHEEARKKKHSFELENKATHAIETDPFFYCIKRIEVISSTTNFKPRVAWKRKTIEFAATPSCFGAKFEIRKDAKGKFKAVPIG
jgi:hypothetical protein